VRIERRACNVPARPGLSVRGRASQGIVRTAFSAVGRPAKLLRQIISIQHVERPRRRLSKGGLLDDVAALRFIASANGHSATTT